MNDLLLRACRGEEIERPPVWMMRQAGRYLPEYQSVRRDSDFMTMVRTPELAVEVTLQPVDVLGVDAAIIFSDILIVPEAMGLELVFVENKGPRFPQPVRSEADLESLRTVDTGEDLGYMLEALKLARTELDGRVPLIGFAGAPWTLAAYMVEGAGTKNFSRAKRFLTETPKLGHRLLERLAESVTAFLIGQIEAGAQVVQIFESWAASLGPRDFREFALPYLARVASAAREAGAPVIVFAPGAGWALEELAKETGADVLGIDWQTEPAAARKRLRGLCGVLQGNLDPCWLYGSEDEVRARTKEMIAGFGSGGHIANLGHGILPDTPVSSARAFVETVKSWRYSDE